MDVGERDGNVLTQRKWHPVDDGTSRVPPRDDEPVGDERVNQNSTLLGGNKAITTLTIDPRT